MLRHLLVPVAALILGTASARGAIATNNLIGTFPSWPSVWTSIPAMNDGSKNGTISDKLDFVGDSSAPGAYYTNTASYLFYRMRVHTNLVTAGTYSDSLLVLIRTNTAASSYPDYGFVWDSKSGNNASHGLEMQVLDAKSGTIWGDIAMDDIDGSSGQKLLNDINGGGRTTDGYVRSIDGQPTAAFGGTAFIDFAVSWNYLYTYTPLRSNQTWYIAFASIANANDHAKLNWDVSGGADPTSLLTVGWVDPGAPPPILAVPEPSIVSLFLGGTAVAFLIGRSLVARR